jgi:hypothetical protein
MALNYHHLDAHTRLFMLDEIAIDVRTAKLYLSDRLSDSGRNTYVFMLRQAAEFHDDLWLAEQLRLKNCFNDSLQRKNPKGGYSTVRMPINAADSLSEGEYNRFYIRGLCRRAIDEGIIELIIYRAKHVENPRRESELRIGSAVLPQALLEDLRVNIAVDTCLGVPAGPNSGLSVRFSM